jgi:hypothetical protein
MAAADEYGIESVGASLSTLEAGRHPDLTTSIDFKPTAEPIPDTASLAVELPAGLTANPQRFPTCSLVTFKNSFATPCPQDSQVGIVEVQFGGGTPFVTEPLYNLEAPEDEVARLGFIGLLYPHILDVDLRAGSDYGVTVGSTNIPSEFHISSIRTVTWGVPADPSHNPQRLTPFEALFCAGTACEAPGGERASGLSPEPFMTNPASCGPVVFGFKATSYLLPGQEFEQAALAGEITDCDKVPFSPSLSLAATSRLAGGPTGLEATLHIPQNEAINTVNSSPLRSAKVVLPEGMTVNASAADGLEACGTDQVGLGTGRAAACPDRSKLGTVEITSPALKRPIEGGIFLRTPEPGYLFRFWLVSNELGVNLKVPAEVELDQGTGRLTTLIQESPQLPAETVVLRFNSGARAPLRNPRACGTVNASYEFGPWSGGAPATGIVPMVIDQGCDGGGFHPALSAGTVSPTAGSFSPFVFDITREDDEQNLSAIEVALPKGLTAKLAGVAICPEGPASSGSCPADSQIGLVKTAVGAGTQPLWVPQAGKDPTALYLAGPYRAAPYSVIAKVPAQAGPFDLGVVAVRSGIYVDPTTAQVTVKSDPLPQILQGIPIDYRRVRVEADRSRFTLNPTSCAEKSVNASVLSAAGAVATPSDRFQAADCASLGFAPKLSLRLNGGTRRTAHPQLQATLQASPGQANIRRVSVALPRSEFLEQAHIRTVCTRSQFAADSCPSGSVYGRASVTTPLLDRPLRGPVYLRSSSHELPDLVVDLKGQIRITLAGRIDSLNGGIRATFTSTPDAPIRRFVLNMKGGRKGLLVNSTELCRSRHLATVEMTGQNGRVRNTRSPLKIPC